jgi:DNA modification methylase
MNHLLRSEVIGDATLHLGDCREIVPMLPKVDAVITSPPYGEQRDYGGNLPPWNENMMGAFSDLPFVDDCQILVNLGLIHRDGEVLPYWDLWRDWMRGEGWRFFSQYVWDQGSGLPGVWNGRLAPSYELVLHFNRKSRTLHKWTRASTWARKQSKSGSGALRLRDGTIRPTCSPEKTRQATKVADNVIRVTREMRRDVAHPAVFPVRFPTELLMSFTDEGHTVLDQFMGSGTTGVACANLGRKFIGIEIEPKYFDTACRRIDAAYAQGRLFA